VYLVTCGHFRSRDKYDGHTIRFTVAENLYATLKLHGCMLYRTGVIADRNFTLREYAFSTIFAPVTLTLTRWPLYTNFTLSLRDVLEVRRWIPSSSLPKVIVLQTYIHHRSYIPRRFAMVKIND